MAKSSGGRRVSKSAVDNYLKALGLRRATAETTFTEGFWNAVRAAGGDPEVVNLHGGFGREAQNVFFLTEELARRTLSSEYARFAEQILDFHELLGFPEAPQRIADLGGGAGVLSMWLARQHPGCEVTVYDHAARQLEFGRKWAAGLALPNIAFVESTYEQLAAKPPTHDCDLVLLYRALDLHPEPPEGERGFLYRDGSGGSAPDPGADVVATTSAPWATC